MQNQSDDKKRQKMQQYIEAYLQQHLLSSSQYNLTQKNHYQFNLSHSLSSIERTITFRVQFGKEAIHIYFSTLLQISLSSTFYTKNINQLNILSSNPHTKYSLNPTKLFTSHTQLTYAQICTDLHLKCQVNPRFINEFQNQFLNFAVKIQQIDLPKKKSEKNHKNSKKDTNVLLHLQQIISSRIKFQNFTQKSNDDFQVKNSHINPQITSIEETEATQTKKKERIEKIGRQYSKFAMNYQNKMLKKSESKDMLSEKILRMIKFQEGFKEKNQHSVQLIGSFVSKFYAEYTIFLLSINKNTNQYLQKLQFEKRQGMVVEKKVPEDGEKKQYFFNEVVILKLLKNQYCGQIASYFIEELSLQEEPSQFYLDYYEKGIQYVKKVKNTKYIIGLLIKLLEGLIFMNKNKLIHRDLKPDNLRLNKTNHIKIIDFGSAYSERQQDNNLKLATTIFYNLKYREINFQVQEAICREKFEKHQLFDMYAFGMIAQQLTDSKYFSLNMKYRMHLSWLLRGCCEQNPQRRIHPMEALCYLSTLDKLQSASTLQ